MKDKNGFRFNNIAEYLETLTEEEKEKYADIIKEHVDREKDVENSINNLKKNTAKLQKIGKKIAEDFDTIIKEAEKINLALTPADNNTRH